MILHSFRHDPGANLSYIIGDAASRSAAVIDPPADPSELLGWARGQGLSVVYVLNTHGHSDHTAGNSAVVKATKAKIAAHRSSGVPKDVPLDDGDVLDVGQLELRILYTPGPTPDGICILAERTLFTGDTLFVGECGRIDLPGGDASALYESLFGKLLALGDETIVLPGHDYGKRLSSTIGEERATNYVLAPRTREEFIAFMAEP